MSAPVASVAGLTELLHRGRGRFDGETVDLLDHSLQCAAVLVGCAEDDAELQVAGLVHDVGTIAEPDRPATHAGTGAAVVAPLLGRRVAWLVAMHADAKRYLVTTDPAYRAALSPHSAVTLEAQGGRLNAATLEALRSHPDLDALLSLRRADDAAKVPGLAVPGLDAWRAALVRLGREHGHREPSS